MPAVAPEQQEDGQGEKRDFLLNEGVTELSSRRSASVASPGESENMEEEGRARELKTQARKQYDLSDVL
jgi:hypothetical protein